MDHHCNWINNCVGLYNYKYFMLYVTYIMLSSLYVVIMFVLSFYFLLTANKQERKALFNGKNQTGWSIITFVIGVIFFMFTKELFTD